MVQKTGRCDTLLTTTEASAAKKKLQLQSLERCTSRKGSGSSTTMVGEQVCECVLAAAAVSDKSQRPTISWRHATVSHAVHDVR